MRTEGAALIATSSVVGLQARVLCWDQVVQCDFPPVFAACTHLQSPITSRSHDRRSHTYSTVPPTTCSAVTPTRTPEIEFVDQHWESPRDSPAPPWGSVVNSARPSRLNLSTHVGRLAFRPCLQTLLALQGEGFRWAHEAHRSVHLQKLGSHAGHTSISRGWKPLSKRKF